MKNLLLHNDERYPIPMQLLKTDMNVLLALSKWYFLDYFLFFGLIFSGIAFSITAFASPYFMWIPGIITLIFIFAEKWRYKIKFSEKNREKYFLKFAFEDIMNKQSQKFLTHENGRLREVARIKSKQN